MGREWKRLKSKPVPAKVSFTINQTGFTVDDIVRVPRTGERVIIDSLDERGLPKRVRVLQPDGTYAEREFNCKILGTFTEPVALRIGP